MVRLDGRRRDRRCRISGGGRVPRVLGIKASKRGGTAPEDSVKPPQPPPDLASAAASRVAALETFGPAKSERLETSRLELKQAIAALDKQKQAGVRAIALELLQCPDPIRAAKLRDKIVQASTPPEDAPPKPYRIEIGDNGRFIGGDEIAIDAVVALLERPAGQRRVDVHVRALDSKEHLRRNPDEYLRLSADRPTYERAIEELLNGGVHYYWKWQAEDLAEAVIELRYLALGGLRDPQSWFTWPASDTGAVREVNFTDEDAESVRTAAYESTSETGVSTSVEGLPEDEPIWLRSIYPAIVWRRVVPVVVLERVRSGSTDTGVIDVTNWVLSDRRPEELSRDATHEACRLRTG